MQCKQRTKQPTAKTRKSGHTQTHISRCPCPPASGPQTSTTPASSLSCAPPEPSSGCESFFSSFSEACLPRPCSPLCRYQQAYRAPKQRGFGCVTVQGCSYRCPSETLHQRTHPRRPPPCLCVLPCPRRRSRSRDLYAGACDIGQLASRTTDGKGDARRTERSHKLFVM